MRAYGPSCLYFLAIALCDGHTSSYRVQQFDYRRVWVFEYENVRAQFINNRVDSWPDIQVWRRGAMEECACDFPQWDMARACYLQGAARANNCYFQIIKTIASWCLANK